MDRHGNSRLPRTASALLLLCFCTLGSIGCNNTCVSGVLAPGGSTVNVKAGNPPPSCSLSTVNGMVSLEIGAASGTSSTPFIVAPLRPRVTHLFVTIAGVDAHSSPLAVDDTPGWQPLAVSLQQHPLQLDLLADPQANASSAQFPDASLPAGAYRQIRLRLASARQGTNCTSHPAAPLGWSSNWIATARFCGLPAILSSWLPSSICASSCPPMSRRTDLARVDSSDKVGIFGIASDCLFDVRCS